MNTRNFSNPTIFYASSPRFTGVDMFLKAITIPGINTNPPELNKRGTHRGYAPSDTLVFNELQMDILIDEKFENYNKIMKTIFQNVDVEEAIFRDVEFDVFIIATDTLGSDKLKWEFANCRIQSVGDIQFDSTDETTEITFNMTLVYDYFKIIDLDI